MTDASDTVPAWSALLAHAAFDSVRPFADRIAALARWPTVEELDAMLRDRLSFPEPVALEAQPPKPKRRRGRRAIERDLLYEARIHLERRIPTRERSMHDLANALVWAAFPRAKRALVARQYAALAARVPAVTDRLPGARTPEQDALAMLDEGGLVLLSVGEGAPPAPLVFGHALLEHVALTTDEVSAFALEIEVRGDARSTQTRVDLADAALASLIAERREGHALRRPLRATLGATPQGSASGSDPGASPGSGTGSDGESRFTPFSS